MTRRATDGTRRARAILGHVAAGLRSAHWYLTSVMGEDAYRRYLAHERATHPDRPPMTESEFWRDRHRRQDADPGSRCC